MLIFHSKNNGISNLFYRFFIPIREIRISNLLIFRSSMHAKKGHNYNLVINTE